MERPHSPPNEPPHPSPANADIEAQAAAWFVRRQGDAHGRRQGGAGDEAAFRAWLGEHPAHGAAYEQIANAWQALDRLPAHEIARWRAEAHEQAKAGAEARALASPGRRAFVPRFALAGTAFALLGGGALAWRLWETTPTFSASYETPRGAFQTVSLPDGSKLDLDTDTRVEARLYRHRREVRLVRGQAMFAVRSNAGCPFEVLARGVTVTVVGTRFAVRCTETGLEHGNVRVAVEEGRVRVAAGSASAAGSVPAQQDVVELTAGQAVATDASGALRAIGTIPAADVAAWRDHRVTFDNTTLLRALQEFERYGATNVRVDAPAVAAMRLTGSFDVRQASRFVYALPRVLPVRLRARGDAIEIVRAV
ncbi:FecR family protein [Paraburkholderia acidisoli]|uniref:DUF4880 domain-containing protein n=1 Tax=Paraburkholderia acidisoli TaxID=2571748 RepID=A0A7Z2GP81_9BURK|nr:FecR domain-containing protein [Paraburkholderia acidisoli]QGZ65159.1 DUF4880 domain-containing protein [Paraburkholderia acidisoli]